MPTQNHLLNALFWAIPAVLFYLLLVWKKQNPSKNASELHPSIKKLQRIKDWILVAVFSFASFRSIYFWFVLNF